MLQTIKLNKKLLISVFLMLFLIAVVLTKYSVGNSTSDKMSVSPNDMMNLLGESQTGEIIYIASLQNRDDHGGGNGMQGSDLVVFDPKTGKKNIIAKNVWAADYSEINDLIVTADTDNKVKLFSKSGEKKAEIGNNGSNPIISHTGNDVVYQKLADEGEDYFILSENAKGLALYDVESGKEKMLTDKSGDYRPIGFSIDKDYLYFNASRPYEPSILGYINIESGLYSLNVQTGEVLRLTNADEQKVIDDGPTMSFIAHDAIWSSDRKIAISSTENQGTYQFKFDGKGGLENVSRISEGTSPAWVVQDITFKVKVNAGNKTEWEEINIK